MNLRELCQSTIAISVILVAYLFPYKVQGQDSYRLAVYALPLTYHNSAVKDNGIATGIGGYYSPTHRNWLEGQADYTLLNFENSDELKQGDFTVAYTTYPGSKVYLRFGGHLTTSDYAVLDTITTQMGMGNRVISRVIKNHSYSNSYSLFTGFHFYKLYKWTLGVDAYWSRYPDLAPALSVYQLTPKLTVTFGDYNTYGSFYLVSRLYTQFLDHSFGYDRKEYYSLEQTLQYYKNRWMLQGFFWTGEQYFAVRNDGFTVFNLAELHKRGVGLELQYLFSPNVGFQAGWYQEWFQELNENQDAYSTGLLFTLFIKK